MKKIKIGDMCIIRYRDASYLYVKNIDKYLKPPQPLLSVGCIRSVAKDFLDIAYVWEHASGKAVEGIVIPIPAIVDITIINDA